MKKERRVKIQHEQELLQLITKELAYISKNVLVDLCKPPSCWSMPKIVLKAGTLYQEIMIGKEPRHSKDSIGKDYYEEDPDAILMDPALASEKKPQKMVQPLQGKFDTTNTITLQYETIESIAKMEDMEPDKYICQVLAHEIFHSVHYAYIRQAYYKGCGHGNWELANALALDYWRGKGYKRNIVMAVREGLARAFEYAWCLRHGYFAQARKLDVYLRLLRRKEPKNPYCAGLSLLKRYENNCSSKNPEDFAQHLTFGILVNAEMSAVYNKTCANMCCEDGWQSTFKDMHSFRTTSKRTTCLAKLYYKQAIKNMDLVNG